MQESAREGLVEDYQSATGAMWLRPGEGRGGRRGEERDVPVGGHCGLEGGRGEQGSEARTGSASPDVKLKETLLSTPTMSTPESQSVTVLYFAAASTATGISSETIALPNELRPYTLQGLIDLLIARYPHTDLAQVFAGSQWSVEAEMVSPPLSDVVLKGGEEVAVIPPVSGG